MSEVKIEIVVEEVGDIPNGYYDTTIDLRGLSSIILKGSFKLTVDSSELVLEDTPVLYILLELIQVLTLSASDRDEPTYGDIIIPEFSDTIEIRRQGSIVTVCVPNVLDKRSRYECDFFDLYSELHARVEEILDILYISTPELSKSGLLDTLNLEIRRWEWLRKNSKQVHNKSNNIIIRGEVESKQ